MSLTESQKRTLCKLVPVLRNTDVIVNTTYSDDDHDGIEKKIFMSAKPCWEECCSLSNCRFQEPPVSSTTLNEMISRVSFISRTNITLCVVFPNGGIKDYTAEDQCRNKRHILAIVCLLLSPTTGKNHIAVIGYPKSVFTTQNMCCACKVNVPHMSVPSIQWSVNVVKKGDTQLKVSQEKETTDASTPFGLGNLDTLIQNSQRIWGRNNMLRAMTDKELQAIRGVFVVKPSTISSAGYGLFTNKDLPSGTMLGAYTGKCYDTLDDAQEDRMRLGTNPDSQYMLYLVSNSLCTYVDGDYHAHPALAGVLSFINRNDSSSRANTQFTSSGNVITTVPIPAGSELFINYGRSYKMPKRVKDTSEGTHLQAAREPTRPMSEVVSSSGSSSISLTAREDVPSAKSTTPTAKEKNGEEEGEVKVEEDEVESNSELTDDKPSEYLCPSVRLLPHQKTHTDGVVRALRTYGVAIDTSSTGGGKTYVACKAAEMLGATNVVVLCTKNIVNTWKDVLEQTRERTVLKVDIPKSVPVESFIQATEEYTGLDHVDVEQSSRTACMYFNDLTPLLRAQIRINKMYKGLCAKKQRPSTIKEYLVVPYNSLTRTATQVGYTRFTRITVPRYTWSGRGKLTRKTADDWKVDLHGLLSFYAKEKGTFLVIDESQYAKNEQSQTSHSVSTIIRLVRENKGWVLLSSATPFDQITQLPHVIDMVVAGSDVSELISRIPTALRWNITGVTDDPGHSWSAQSIMRRALQCPEDQAVITCLLRLQTMGAGSTELNNVVHAMINMYNRKDIIDFASVETRRLPNVQDTISFLNRMSFGTNKSATFAAMCALLFLPYALDRNVDMNDVMTLVTQLMPEIIFTMTPFVSAHKAHYAELYLEKVDVSDIIVEEVYLPEYHRFNTDACPAPLTSASGHAVVDEVTALQWRNDAEWIMGSEKPIRVWEEVERSAGTNEQQSRDAKDIVKLCTAARRLALERDARDEEVAEQGSSNQPGAGIQRLELVKAEALSRVVNATVVERPDVKVVVMFNYILPLERFVESLKRINPALESKIRVITGATPQHKRAEYVKEFQEQSLDVQIICGIITVVGVAISLHDVHGKRPRVSFIMASGSAQTATQAKGRVFRATSRSDALIVTVYGGHSLGGKKEKALIERLTRREKVMGIASSSTAHQSLSDSFVTSKLTTMQEFSAKLQGVNHVATEAVGELQTPSTATTGSDEYEQATVWSMFGPKWVENEFAARTWHLLKEAQSKKNPNVITSNIFRTITPASGSAEDISNAQLLYCHLRSPAFAVGSTVPLSVAFVYKNFLRVITVLDIDEEPEGELGPSISLTAMPSFWALTWSAVGASIKLGHMPLAT